MFLHLILLLLFLTSWSSFGTGNLFTPEYVLLILSNFSYYYTTEQPRTLSKFRIVGGKSTNITQFPFMVSIQNPSGYHVCGGSILNKNWVLTAAHCVIAVIGFTKVTIASVKHYEIVAGISNFRSDSSKFTKQTRYPSFFMIHDKFNLDNLEYDFGLIKVKKPFTFGTVFVGSVPFPTERIQNIEQNSTNCVTTGWGYTKPMALGHDKAFPMVGSEKLMKVDLKLIPTKKCVTLYPELNMNSGNYLCTLTKDKDACEGDSGGPLLCNGIQVGIVSFGRGCAQELSPGVYTRVDIHLNWIRNSISNNLGVNKLHQKCCCTVIWYISSIILFLI